MKRFSKNDMVTLVDKRQEEIVSALESIQGKKARIAPWKREEGGGGKAALFSDGKVLERGGVNVSTVHGKVFPTMLSMLKIPVEKSEGLNFFATGISLVLHPRSPYIPTVHANFRYFEITENEKLLSWFFGGGADLTPYYLFEEDARHFHQTLKNACDLTDPGNYASWKDECDRYFYLPHRKEHRGIGGIFCFRRNEKSREEIYMWAENCSRAFLPSYLPIVEKRKTLFYADKERKWQLQRRGRYVEFNLMYDLGTLFGFQSGGHTENILMSLPPQVHWEYDVTTLPGTPEDELMKVLKAPKDWLS